MFLIFFFLLNIFRRSLGLKKKKNLESFFGDILILVDVSPGGAARHPAWHGPLTTTQAFYFEGLFSFWAAPFCRLGKEEDDETTALTAKPTAAPPSHPQRSGDGNLNFYLLHKPFIFC